MKAGLEKLQKDYGQRALENKKAQRPSMRCFNIANAGCKSKIRRLQAQADRATAQLKQIQKKVALKTVNGNPVRLEKESIYPMPSR